MVATATAQGKADRGQGLDKKEFLREFGAWSYALLISLLPSFVVFILLYGTINKL
jgi:hypothetical protein